MGSVARCFGKVVTLNPGHDSPFETDLFQAAASACERAGGRDGDLARGSLTAAVRWASQFSPSWRIKEVYHCSPARPIKDFVRSKTPS